MTFVVLSIMLCLKLLDMIELSPFLSSYCFRLIVLKLQKFFFLEASLRFRFSGSGRRTYNNRLRQLADVLCF